MAMSPSSPSDKVNVNTHKHTAQPNISPTPDTTKVYFKLLQALHHAEIITGSFSEKNSFPKGMSNKVNRMTMFIKPSSPNPSTLEKVKLNTKDWIRQNFLILREHYD